MDIKQLNQSVVKINNVDNEMRDQLDQHFSKFFENYLHIPSYKNGIWDGKEHFYNRKLSTLPLGLLNNLKTKFGTYIDKIDVFEKENLSLDFKSFYNNLNLKEGYDIRDYQKLGFESSVTEQKTILKAATGAGKSLIMWLITKYAAEMLKHDVLIIVPQIMLVEQLEDDFNDYGKFKYDLEIGKSTTKKIGKREAKKLGLNFEEMSEENQLKIAFEKNIVISTWQSLQHKPKEYFERFKTIIMDEVHLLEGATIQKIVQSCKNTTIRIGLTGTLKQDPKSKMMYESLFHTQKLLITSRELIDRGFAAEVFINPIIMNYKGKAKYNDLNDEIKYIRDNHERVNFIHSLVKGLIKRGGNNNTLVLFKSVEKGFWEELEERFSEFADNVFIIHGKKDLKLREEARKKTELGNNTIILASFATFSTGVNIKRIHNILFTESYASMVKIVQAIGRGMRIHDGKKHVNIFDITDKFKIQNHTFKQYKKRLQIYNNFEYIVKSEKVYQIKNI